MNALSAAIAACFLFVAPIASADSSMDIYHDEIHQISIDPALADCFMCSSSDSKDKCAGHQQCKGTRKHCEKIGCKITGTSSCSTAANVKICQSETSETEMMEVAPLAADCFMCSSSDSKDKCAGHQQCKGTRKHCQKIGCKITGTSSCSTAANVKICSFDGSSLDAEEAAHEESMLCL